MSLRLVVLVLVSLAVLAGSFAYFRPAAPPAADRAPDAAGGARPARIVELVVQDGRRLIGPAVIQALQGEALILRVTSDRADELHVHGYDASLGLEPGPARELRLMADKAGRFEIELHRAHAELATLEVHPH